VKSGIITAWRMDGPAAPPKHLLASRKHGLA
jgi:hypothetical protein